MADDDDVYRLWVGSMRRAFDDAVERGYLSAIADAEKLVQAIERLDPGQRTEAHVKLLLHTQEQLRKGYAEQDKRVAAEETLFGWFDTLIGIRDGKISEFDIQNVMAHIWRQEDLSALSPDLSLPAPEVWPETKGELEARAAASKAAGENWLEESLITRLWEGTLAELAQLERVPEAERTETHRERMEWLKRALEGPAQG